MNVLQHNRRTSPNSIVVACLHVVFVVCEPTDHAFEIDLVVWREFIIQGNVPGVSRTHSGIISQFQSIDTLIVVTSINHFEIVRSPVPYISRTIDQETEFSVFGTCSVKEVPVVDRFLRLSIVTAHQVDFKFSGIGRTFRNEIHRTTDRIALHIRS
ncbi:hypothetical protein D3C71_775010 [compost metagenome]